MFSLYDEGCRSRLERRDVYKRQRLQSRIRQVDTLARSGGEEFTAIIGALS